MEKLIELSHEAIVVNEVIDFCRDPQCGSVNVFAGTVRNQAKGKEVTHLFFEAYETMALQELHKIADKAAEKWPIHKIAIVHRLGNVQVGQDAVLIVVATPHRKEGFESCAFVIDSLKKSVPIWKKEFWVDGSHWVSATP
ncbi:molybdenum cofactor biosynthesis protein MoaE [bacterium]|nr:molybdenum cofactor biosynthesis protein MoaE [bacterium]